MPACSCVPSAVCRVPLLARKQCEASADVRSLRHCLRASNGTQELPEPPAYGAIAHGGVRSGPFSSAGFAVLSAGCGAADCGDINDDNAIDQLYGDNTGTNADIGFDWYILNFEDSGAKDLIKNIVDATELLAKLDID